MAKKKNAAVTDTRRPAKPQPARLSKTIAKQIRDLAEREVDRLHAEGLRGEKARNKLVTNLKRDVHCDAHRRTRLSEVKECSDCQLRLREALTVGGTYLDEVERLATLLDAAKKYVADHYGARGVSLDDFGWCFIDPARIPDIEADLEKQAQQDVSGFEALGREKERVVPSGWLMVLVREDGLFPFAVDADTALTVSRYRQRLWPGTYQAAGKDGAEPRNRVWTQQDEDMDVLWQAHARLKVDPAKVPLLTEGKWRYVDDEFLKNERERLVKMLEPSDVDARWREGAALSFTAMTEASGWLAKGLKVLGHASNHLRWYFVALDVTELASYKRYWSAVLRERKRLEAVYGEDLW